MNHFRIALANIRFPAAPEESITLAQQAVDQASLEGARIICFPECFIPGYRGVGNRLPPPDPELLERAWSVVAEAAAKASLTVVLGTERVVDGGLVATALVIAEDGLIAGFQDAGAMPALHGCPYLPPCDGSAEGLPGRSRRATTRA